VKNFGAERLESGKAALVLTREHRRLARRRGDPGNCCPLSGMGQAARPDAETLLFCPPPGRHVSGTVIPSP